MRNKLLWLPAAAAVTLLSLSSTAWAGNACSALTTLYTSAPRAITKAQSGAKSLHEAMRACRSQLNAPSASPDVQAAAPAAGGEFAIFDIPGNPDGPVPVAINNAGAVAGYYFDTSGLQHSFLRAPDGNVIAFDPPGTVCNPAVSSFCSGAAGITAGGVIIGSYVDVAGGHGYLRTPDGKFQTWDVPGSNNSTSPTASNPSGAVTGQYTGGDGLFHGFVLQTNGIYTTFDPPASAYTLPTDVNSPGVIVGAFFESVPGVPVGFIRAKNGSMTPFNAPASGVINTYPTIALNAQGTAAGSFCSDAQCDAVHGFLRAADGTMTVVDAPGDNYATQLDAINETGDTTGSTIPSDFSAQHGFVRTQQGTFGTIDPPGSGFTSPFAINDPGAVAGNFCDPTVASCHGFVWIPHR
ncbi:hypothetical protein C9I57_13115 [Trinickia symbiotica]|uniref:Uncharacterized protein n=1 Tax=Trinickia symbiotica TaxID=863227 RepID=A0A2T3XU49_9BURK|nr:hypothetical protein [Trinickia symbiotica]PTB20049.1 hypothetical protein C9I57_13115 [Trinickia symbiotica]